MKFRAPNLPYIPNLLPVPNPRLQSEIPSLFCIVSRIMSGVLKQAVLPEAHNSRSFHYTPKIGIPLKLPMHPNGGRGGGRLWLRTVPTSLSLHVVFQNDVFRNIF